MCPGTSTAVASIFRSTTSLGMDARSRTLEARRLTPEVRGLLAFECARAHEFYQRAMAARPDADRRRLAAAEIMRAVYFEYLRRIERRGYDVFAGKVRLARPEQAFIALRQWLWPA